MPFDYRFMPGNIVRNIVPPQPPGEIRIPQFTGLTVLGVTRPHEPGLGGFWITAGKLCEDDGHTFPTLSGVDWLFELDPNAEQKDVPYYKVTQKRHTPPLYWPNLYISIEDAREFIRRLAYQPWMEPMRRDKTTYLHIVDAYDWILETYYLVKRYEPTGSNGDKALFPYLAHIGDEDKD